MDSEVNPLEQHNARCAEARSCMPLLASRSIQRASHMVPGFVGDLARLEGQTAIHLFNVGLKTAPNQQCSMHPFLHLSK